MGWWLVGTECVAAEHLSAWRRWLAPPSCWPAACRWRIASSQSHARCNATSRRLWSRAIRSGRRRCASTTRCTAVISRVVARIRETRVSVGLGAGCEQEWLVFAARNAAAGQCRSRRRAMSTRATARSGRQCTVVGGAPGYRAVTRPRPERWRIFVAAVDASPIPGGRFVAPQTVRVGALNACALPGIM